MGTEHGAGPGRLLRRVARVDRSLLGAYAMGPERHALHAAWSFQRRLLFRRARHEPPGELESGRLRAAGTLTPKSAFRVLSEVEFVMRPLTRSQIIGVGTLLGILVVFTGVTVVRAMVSAAAPGITLREAFPQAPAAPPPARPADSVVSSSPRSAAASAPSAAPAP